MVEVVVKHLIPAATQQTVTVMLALAEQAVQIPVVVVVTAAAHTAPADLE
jgi:ribosomal protein S12 methylthiotransferase accessory factor YcaO